jgi:hypothetical protein
MTATEKNEHYGMLNDRFDGRANRLRKLGFVYVCIEEFNIAVFSIKRFGKTMTISAGTIMNADEVVWADTVEQAERFVA